MKKRRFCRKGFTLIELLIVIAIIAILALIAIPNFLEAQTRSKVSRCMSDMRSLAIAIEAYYVDCNSYPQSEYGPTGAVAIGSDDLTEWYLRALTTPVAFISQCPKDPFVVGGVTATSGQVAPFKTYHYCRYVPEDEPLHPNAWGAIRTAMRRGFMWSLSSVGPSRQEATNQPETWHNMLMWNFLAGNPTDGHNTYLYLYDPTNGTISRGYIVDTNKGFVTGVMLK